MGMKDVAEYARSGQASCKGCGAAVAKGALRVGKAAVASNGFAATQWYHPKCYAGVLAHLEGATSADALSGLKLLKATDQQLLRELLPPRGRKRKESAGPERPGEGGEKAPGRRRGPGGAAHGLDQTEGAEEVVPVYGEGKPDEGQREDYNRADWEATLACCIPANLPSFYKGAQLPSGWKSFGTVIISEGAGVEGRAKIAAFDFDGCLVNTNVRRHGPRAWSLRFPSVPSVLRGYHKDGFKLVIFTNESNIDRFVNQRQKAVDSKVGRLEGLQAAVAAPIQVFIACGRSGTGDPSRKPGPGMWDLLERHFNGGVAVDKQSSFFVGDAAGRKDDFSASDKIFAEAVGLRFMVPEEVFAAGPEPP